MTSNMLMSLRRSCVVSCRFLARSNRPSQRALSTEAKPVSHPPQGLPRPTIPEEEPPIELSGAIHARNAALAISLMSFCAGVTYYSMNAVGQAGSTGSDDPLAALREEAASAQDKQSQEAKSTDEAADMLKKFQAGEFDPDKYEELGAEESGAKKNRPWWKFW